MSIEIREVWASNLDAEFRLIREIVDDYPYVALDTEYPGVVYKNPDNHYKELKSNVDLLKLIQLGLTFSDESGELPTCGTCNKFLVWQFNFREFNPDGDEHDRGSIAMLRGSGIDLERNRREGIRTERFGELLMSSGVVLNPDVVWVTFHGDYDFGYLLKVLRGRGLPDKREEFFECLKVFCPVVYDVKYMMRVCDAMRGGRLERLAAKLGLRRVGVSHQAGSNSAMTSLTFFKLKERFFRSRSLEKYAGVVHALEFN